jgi:transketolase
MRKVAIERVYALAQRDPRVVFVGSDLGAGVLAEMQAAMPDRFFMEGVSEQAIIGIAAGLAMHGFQPYINTIATFLTRRCLEQIAIDLCLHGLPVRLLASGGGAVYAPLGPTHMATDDVALLRPLPGMTIVAPCDAEEMGRVMDASLDVAGPLYVRIAKGNDPVVSTPDLPFRIGAAISMRPARDVLFVSTGVMTSRALAAADRLATSGIAAGVVHVHTIKPLDTALICDAATDVPLVVTVEEHTLIGGLGAAIAEAFADAGLRTPLLRLGLPDAYLSTYGGQDDILLRAGLTPDGIAVSAEARLNRAVPLVNR